MKHLILAASAVMTLTLPAMAGGVMVPIPLAGAAGPVGLAVLGVGYGVVRLVRWARRAR